jgi:hypothetical protein
MGEIPFPMLLAYIGSTAQYVLSGFFKKEKNCFEATLLFQDGSGKKRKD